MAQRAVSGTSAKDIGGLAESTLRDMICVWLDKTGTPEPAKLVPDSQKIDLEVEFPSLWGGVAPFLRVFIQIKSTSRFLRSKQVKGFKSPCLEYPIQKRDWKGLRDQAKASDSFYVALALNRGGFSVSELLQQSPGQRFEWYIVDFKQQVERLQEDDEQSPPSIFFPIQNLLNLSTFSLLWSALWTKRFFAPLDDGRLYRDAPELGKLVPRIFQVKEIVDRELFSDWDFLTLSLPKFERRFDKAYFTDLSFKLGLGHALGIISHKMYDNASKLDAIINYCPESLYGTANLWLFSRCYRKFMEASGQVVSRVHGQTNLRFLPLPGPVEDISQLMKACLWHVALQYASLGVEVKLVYKPEINAGQDHSYYGGGIGYFPWISLADDGVSWMIANNRSATTGEHIDFLRSQMQNEYLTLNGSTLPRIAGILDIPQDELRTAKDCPEQLFPSESLFVQYPYSIFGKDLTFGFRYIAPTFTR